MYGCKDVLVCSSKQTFPITLLICQDCKVLSESDPAFSPLFPSTKQSTQWAPKWDGQPTLFLSSSVYQDLREERAVHDRRSQPLKNLPSFMIIIQFIRVMHKSDSMTVCVESQVIWAALWFGLSVAG